MTVSLIQQEASSPPATVCISSIYQVISHLTQHLREMCLQRPHLCCYTTQLKQSHGFMIWCDRWWELTHLYVTQCSTVGGRAILLPSAPHRAAVARCRHSFQLAGRCDCWAGGDTRRSIQVLPAPTLSTVTQAHLYKLQGRLKWVDDGENKWRNNELLRMHDNWQYICLSSRWTFGHHIKTQLNWLIRNRLGG